MQPITNATVHIVDDDADVRDALAWLLRSRRLFSESYDSAAAFIHMLQTRGLLPSDTLGARASVRSAPGAYQPAFLRRFAPARQPQCLLLDVRMPGMSGLSLFERLRQAGDLIRVMPVIFLTGHADVPTAVQTVKQGAFDFCEKPFSDNVLLDRIEQALAQSAAYLTSNAATSELNQRIAELTSRERSVVELVVQGVPNKVIADQLGISVRTVEVHRARVFEKMQVKSAVELANLLHTLPEFAAEFTNTAQPNAPAAPTAWPPHITTTDRY